MNAPLQDILTEFHRRLAELCDARLERLILFGSRARGDDDPASDIDILVVLNDETAIIEYKSLVTDVVHELSLENDTLISCVFTTPEKIDSSGLPFYRNVRREGVAL